MLTNDEMPVVLTFLSEAPPDSVARLHHYRVVAKFTFSASPGHTTDMDAHLTDTYFTASSSTMKCSVAFGGTDGGEPAGP